MINIIIIIIGLKRGTSELKKYLVSRIQPGEVLPQVKQAAFMDMTGTSGVIGGGEGSGVGIDRHKLSSTRALEYVSVYLSPSRFAVCISLFV